MVDLGMEKAAFKALSSLALDGSLVWRFSVSRICGVWRRPRFVEQELFMLQLSYVDLFGRHQFSVPLTADEVISTPLLIRSWPEGFQVRILFRRSSLANPSYMPSICFRHQQHRSRWCSMRRSSFRWAWFCSGVESLRAWVCHSSY